MRKLLLASFAVALVVSMTSAQANHSWGTYHWARTSNPFSVTLVDSVTGVWDSLLPPVSSDWAASSVLNTNIQSGATGLLDRLLCNPMARKARVCNANYGPNLWFGLATVWVSNGHISQATTRMNDYYFTGTYGNNIARRHVLCQEVGHDFGLDHQHGVPSCMEDKNSTLNTASYQSPNAHDYDQLVTIYKHTDSFSSSSSSSASARNFVRPDRIQRIGGQTVLTFIYWVDGHAH